MQIFQVDAFSDRPFGGNPAAVCLLSEPKPDLWMQQLAQEMNLSETAFLLPEKDGYRLRWFTPAVEVNLCGHATLASAHVLWSEGLLERDRQATFYTLSGTLTANFNSDWIELNFPASPPKPLEAVPTGLAEALGLEIQAIWKDDDLNYLLIEVATPEIVSGIQPNFTALGPIHPDGIIITAAGREPYDFVSRFFAPAYGIDEDPVTGSAHCVLGPYWQQRLSKPELLAYQSSARGGIVKVRLEPNVVQQKVVSQKAVPQQKEVTQQKTEDSDRTNCDRIILSGQAVTVFQGNLSA